MMFKKPKVVNNNKLPNAFWVLFPGGYLLFRVRIYNNEPKSSSIIIIYFKQHEFNSLKACEQDQH